MRLKNCCLNHMCPSAKKQLANAWELHNELYILLKAMHFFLRFMLFVTLPRLADPNSNWRSKVKEVPLEKRYGYIDSHKLKNKIVFLAFLIFQNSTKKTRINGNIHLLFKLITLGLNHWQRRNFTVPWEPIIWKRKHTRTDFSFQAIN